MKKMILVPEDTFEKYQSESYMDTSTTTATRLTLQEIINQILNIFNSNTNILTDEDKITIITQLQNRFKNINKNLNKEEFKEMLEPKTIIENIENEKEKINLNSFPKTLKVKASNFIDFIVDKQMAWNHKNELIIDNKPIDNSNIVDLIRFAVSQKNKSKKYVSPNGWHEFSDYLKKQNIPKHFISNEKLYKKYFTRATQKKSKIKPKIETKSLEWEELP